NLAPGTWRHHLQQAGARMEAIELIVTALRTGAATVADDTASAPVRDAYAALTAQLRTRLTDGETMLATWEDSPQTDETELAAALTAAGADRDRGVLTAAQAVMSVADEPGWRAGRY